MFRVRCVQSSKVRCSKFGFNPDRKYLAINGCPAWSSLVKPGQPPPSANYQLSITNYQLQMPFPVQGPNACEKNEERLPHAAFSSQVHLLIHQRSTAFNGGQRRLTAQKKIKR